MSKINKTQKKFHQEKARKNSVISLICKKFDIK